MTFTRCHLCGLIFMKHNQYRGFIQQYTNLDILKLLSEYRTSLMGIAMVWVILHHCNCNTHYHLNFIYSFPLLNLGYSGVDIFILLSGFGIYYSLNKNSDIGCFLQKRIIRFLPAVPIFIIYIFYKKMTSFHEIVGMFTLENFWIRDSFLGYLSYAFFFYLLSPLIKNIIDNHIKNDIFKQLSFLIILFIITIPYWKTGQLVGISRILIFTFGMYLCYFFCNDKELNKNFLNYSYLLSLLGFTALIIAFTKFLNIRQDYGLIYYPELLFIPGLCYAIVIMFSYIKKYNNLPINIFNIIGKYSLNIYCVDFYITTCIKFKTFWLHFCLSLLIGILYGVIYDKIKSLNLKMLPQIIDKSH